MPLQHACFISYRHAQHELMKRFVDEFYEALAGELEALVDLKVYRDLLRLQGGDFYNAQLARSLCESVCMIMIFTPTYFSEAHPYCTREYAAMKEIEAQRLKLNAGHGLIIPVVLRNFDALPHEIKSQRQVYRFDQFQTSDRKLSKDRKCSEAIGTLARYVAERCQEMRELEVDCQGYTMPDDETVRRLAAQLTAGPAIFPGREAVNG